MLKVTLTMGLPASGKSTWAKALIEKDPSTRRVNRDSLREMMGAKSQWQTEEFENHVSDVQKRIVLGFLARGYNVVIDDCNTYHKTVRDIRKWIQFFVDSYKTPVMVEQKVFDTDYYVCLQRDKDRNACYGWQRGHRKAFCTYGKWSGGRLDKEQRRYPVSYDCSGCRNRQTKGNHL